MSWMTPNMKMETTSNGGIGKALGRMFSGDTLFQNRYTAQGGPGQIAFASCFPGSIKVFDIAPGKEMIVQKSAFLASEASVNLSIFFQKKIGAGFFGGEGFIMQKLSGHGTVFVEIDYAAGVASSRYVTLLRQRQEAREEAASAAHAKSKERAKKEKEKD